jgi:nucleotide-binding universal stress UspA family protein
VHAPVDTDARLSELVGALTKTGRQVRLRMVHGAAADAILRAADEEHADLIVMSTHGRGGMGRLFYGSVADQVLRHTTRPIVLISATCTRSWAVDGRFRLLVPLDGSASAEAALGVAEQTADALEAEVVLLRVVEPADGFAALDTSYLPARSQRVLDEARTYLDGIVTRLSRPGRIIATRVEAGDPATKIASVARDADVDLIVMATHGSGGLVRFTMGSVATATLHRANTPMLLVRAALPRSATGGVARGTSSTPRTVTVI